MPLVVYELVGLMLFDKTPFPKFQEYDAMLPTGILEVFVNWTTVLMQLEGGLKAKFGKGYMVMGMATESRQPRSVMALN